MQANASKHKAMTYERMAEEEKRLSLEIEELLERAGTIDQEEDERLGVEETEEAIPAELAVGSRARSPLVSRASL